MQDPSTKNLLIAHCCAEPVVMSCAVVRGYACAASCTCAVVRPAPAVCCGCSSTGGQERVRLAGWWRRPHDRTPRQPLLDLASRSPSLSPRCGCACTGTAARFGRRPALGSDLAGAMPDSASGSGRFDLADAVCERRAATHAVTGRAAGAGLLCAGAPRIGIW
jgi:hypothetical protein